MKKARKACARNASATTGVTIKVLRAVALELLIPPNIKNPKRAAEQAVKGWPNRKAITERGITILAVIEGVEAQDPETPA